MTELPTIQQLLADESLLRRVCTEVLQPGPWKHKRSDWSPNTSQCIKCRRHGPVPDNTDCPVPDPDERPWEVIAEMLLTYVSSKKGAGLEPRDAECAYQMAMIHVSRKYMREFTLGYIPTWTPDGWYAWCATPIERVLCCLLVLLPEKIRVSE